MATAKKEYIISGRFARIHALQTLYAYTIQDQVESQAIKEALTAELRFDIFWDPIETASTHQREQKIAEELWEEIVQNHAPLPTNLSKKTQEAIKKHLSAYQQAKFKKHLELKNQFWAIKDLITKNYGSTIHILRAWQKIAQNSLDDPDVPTGILQEKLASNELLKRFEQEPKWQSTVTQYNGYSGERPNCTQSGYAAWIQLKQASSQEKKITQMDEIGLLNWMVKHVIFETALIEDHYMMVDCNWKVHKHLVATMVDQTFLAIEANCLQQLHEFGHQLNQEWQEKNETYCKLIEHFLTNDQNYESLIEQTTKKWQANRIVLVDKIILKLGLVELVYCKNVPFKVVLNEYIDLAKRYGQPKSGQFVNGVLESMHTTLHPQDIPGTRSLG